MGFDDLAVVEGGAGIAARNFLQHLTLGHLSTPKLRIELGATRAVAL